MQASTNNPATQTAADSLRTWGTDFTAACVTAFNTATQPLFTAPDLSVAPTPLLHSWIDSALAVLRSMFAGLHAAVPNVPPSKALDRLPRTAADFPSHFQTNHSAAPKLQHFLVQQAAQLRYFAAVEDAKASGDVHRLAHLHSHAAPHASTWKRTIPAHKSHTLAAAHYLVSARLNLGLHPYPTLLPADCASCRSKGAIQLDPWHHLCCNMHKRREINLRHDSVVNALYHHASHSGAAACKEPPGLSTEDGRRPDLQIILPGACILTDVVVSHPLAPSHLLAASRSALIVARQAVNRKQRHYQEVANSQHAEFIPFSCESTGGISQEAERVINRLSLACQDHLTLPSNLPFVNAVHSSVAIAIQRGNALAILAGYSRAVMRVGRGWSVTA